MDQLRKSPFKNNKVERDPKGFGLRPKEIKTCAEALFNEQSILISGSRGIGKSSLGEQMRIILEGDNTLLKRCETDTKFDKTLCIYQYCGDDISLDQLVTNILIKLESKYRFFPQVETTELTHGFTITLLEVIKANLEATVISSQKSTTILASQFVECVREVGRRIKKFGYKGINIFLDEVNLLPKEIKLGSFLREVHETLDNDDLGIIVTFTLAGLKGIYTRLRADHGSFDRIIKHIPLTTLSREYSQEVLRYAAKKAKPRFSIDKEAEDAILGISSGHPDTMHLIGDATYLLMEDIKKMTLLDVLRGIMSIIAYDKKEKYTEMLRKCTNHEKRILLRLSSYIGDSVPRKIPIKWITKSIRKVYSEQNIQRILDKLERKGYLVFIKNQQEVKFTDELFRLCIDHLINQERILQKIKKEDDLRLSLQRKIDEYKIKANITESTEEMTSFYFVDEMEDVQDALYFEIENLQSDEDDDNLHDLILEIIERQGFDNEDIDSLTIDDIVELLAVERGRSSLIELNMKTDWDFDENIFAEEDLIQDDSRYFDNEYFVDDVYRTDNQNKGE